MITNESISKLTSELYDFCNLGYGQSDFDKTAENITAVVHRYCQNELWKFVKRLIRAMAKCPYDGRNATMHEEAAKVYEFMRDSRFVSE